MKTRMKTIEVPEQYAEVTREELMSLKRAMRGGNATQDTAGLLIYASKLLCEGHDGIAQAMRERALFLTSGIEQIDRIIWPSDDSGTADGPGAVGGPGSAS